jgi:circadian clock protein KaiC
MNFRRPAIVSRGQTGGDGLDPVSPPRISTGIAGLDNLLAGGLPRRGLYLLEGASGTGKTTFVLQFLLAGVAANERALLVAISDTAGEVRAFAETHGWSLDGVEIMDLSDLQSVVDETGRQTVFHRAEVEFTKLTNLIAERIEKTRAVRAAIDSLTELRHLAEEESIYRLQMETLKPILLGNDRTILMVDEALLSGTIHTLAQGVIGISYSIPEFGPYRRHLSIQKLRGAKFKEGLHDFEILTGGIVVYPRLVALEQRLSEAAEQLSTGISAFDAILCGGLDRGTSTIFMGPAGSGKSILATRVALAAAERGEKVTVYAFEESLATLINRSAGLGMDLQTQLASGYLTLRIIDPLELTPGKFADLVRTAVDDEATMIVIDSLTGYVASMGAATDIALQIRNLLTFLAQRNVTTLLVSIQGGLFGSEDEPSGTMSYLADTVVLLRYYEHLGEVRRALSVLKKRRGAHERTIRDIEFSTKGIEIGPPLCQFRGILTGVPEFEPVSE